MSDELFTKVAQLLKHYIVLLDKQSFGNTDTIKAQAIADELDLLMGDKKFVQHIQDEIELKERQIVSDDIADEILNGTHCIGSSCDD